MDSHTLYRSKAPFRLGIAGGGTDVSPYSDLYGGAILNVTIDRFAYATLRLTDDGKIRFIHVNDNLVQEYDAVPFLEPDGPLTLQCGIYNRIVRQFNDGVPFSFELTTQMDVPSGSGLGTSSTLVVAILGAFVEARNLPLGKYDIARFREREGAKYLPRKFKGGAPWRGVFNECVDFREGMKPLLVRNDGRDKGEYQR